ncbi:NnrS family protein [Stenotrophomonas sp. YIM B06876]|uniref:NnrS family protein n=1 Tax=Stenotrophomonas sp. YIM B06876 TaxID=3060211 RepID=UPI00273A25BE|nr:NnrS family protein [Stenotrophomonas sp. YIM B06876]
METASALAQGASARQLLQAPHRLLFFVGASNLLLAMLWWALWLASHLGKGWPMPQTPVYAGWVHAFVMLYLVLPSFIFGFLLTVFPRWMGLPDLLRWRHVPVGAGLMGGQLLILLSLSGWRLLFIPGLLLAAAGWTAGLLILGRLLFAEKGRTWHARSCFAALLIGYAGVLCFIAFTVGAPPALALLSIKLGGMGLLLPVYLTVAHRMFPFFAGNVVPGYTLWRPLPWLTAVWTALLLRLPLELAQVHEWLWVADAALLLLSLQALWHWWPRARMPGLLAALFIGLAWLPVTFSLYLLQSAVYALSGEFILGRAPIHALSIGFFGSVLVAMVTRVTQGHSGRPLAMYAAAWFAFFTLQGVAVMRVVAEIVPDALLWQVLSAAGWLLALLPWVSRIGWIYLSPRLDGRPG